MRALIAALALVAWAPGLARQDFPRAPWHSRAGRGGEQQTAVPSTAAPARRIVRVDVIATDGRGRTVENLRPADFVLQEDGAAQAIEEARFIKVDKSGATGDPPPTIQSDADERAEASRPNTRLFGFFLDEYHVSAADSPHARDTLAQFIDDTLGPNDLLVVMRPLDSILHIRLTRDREHVREIVEAFEGRKADYTPRGESERNIIAGTPEHIEQVRAQVTTSALNALAAHLGSVSGEARKTLVVVSEGVPRVDRRRALELLPTLDSVIRSANRSNVSIYAIDPRGGMAPAAGSPDDGDGLRALTAATGGQNVTVGDLSAGMRRIEADSSAYYLLSYTTTQRQDDKLHSLQVSVKKAGISLRARQGYWAVAPDEGLRADLLRPRQSSPPEPPGHVSLLVKPWFGASRGAAGKTRVTFVWEPAPPVPGVRTKTLYPSRVVLKVLAADGTSLFEGTVLPTGPLRPDPADEAQARAVFDALPGRVKLRMSIEDDVGQAIDSDVRDLAVRDLTAPVVIGTPEILRARTARDFRALASDPEAAPVASREFSRAERLMIRVPVYAPSGTVPTVSARLLNRLGQTMRELVIHPEAAAPAPDEIDEIDLPLAALAAGQYLVEVVVKTPAAEVKDQLEFRVTS
jgi:VWFA-related protein